MRTARVPEVEGFDLIRGTKKVKLIMWEELDRSYKDKLLEMVGAQDFEVETSYIDSIFKKNVKGMESIV